MITVIGDMETKAMEKWNSFWQNDGFILLVMSLFTYLKQRLQDGATKIQWRLGAIKVFVNAAAGWGFYTLLQSYDIWFGVYPQKVGIIMIVVYVGTKVMDLVAEAIYKINFKDWLRKWLN